MGRRLLPGSLCIGGGNIKDTGAIIRNGPAVSPRFFPIGVCAYVSSLLVLSIMLFPILAPQGLDKLLNFSTFRSMPPAVGALLACWWLKQGTFRWSSFAKFLATTSITLAAIAGFASFLISALNNEPEPIPALVFDAAQGLVSGLAIGFLAEVTRAYLTKTSIPGEARRGQNAPTPATSGALEGAAVTGARIGF